MQIQFEMLQILKYSFELADFRIQRIWSTVSFYFNMTCINSITDGQLLTLENGS